VKINGVPAITGGRHLIGCWAAGDLVRPLTDAADALALAETASNRVNDEYLNFPNGVTRFAGLSFRAPESLDEGAAFELELEWIEAPAAAAHVCRWQAEIQAQGDGDLADSAWSAPAAADDTGSAGTRRKVLLPPIIPSGSWAAGDTIHARIARVGAHANDTLDVGARLLRATLFANVNARNDV
jgi:hypothetical protein